MPLTSMKPHKRIIIGRNITLAAAIAYALTRAALNLNGTPEGGVTAFLTGNGHLAWVWSLAWVSVAALCVWDWLNHQTRYGLSMLVGLTFAWGISYVAAWGINGFTGTEWASAIGWLAPAAFIFGFLIKVTALHDTILSAGGEGDEDGDHE